MISKRKEEFQKLVNDLKKTGIIIEESNFKWLNPVVLVRNKTGVMRFCTGLRKVNDLVDLDSFELPLIIQTIRSLHDMEYFSLINLKNGYFQLGIAIAIEKRQLSRMGTIV